jgi:hypothetical protein
MPPKDAPPDLSRQFCNCPGEGIDFGLLKDDVANALTLPSWPIRLQVGISGPNGFGKAHIESTPNRLNMLQNLGFSTVERYAKAVARNYTKVCDANESNRIALVYRYKEYDLCLVLEQRPEKFWGVTTGFANRAFRKATLWVQSQEGGSESPPKVAEPSRFETLSLPKAKAPGGSGS